MVVLAMDLMEYISPCFAGCTKLNINPITKAIVVRRTSLPAFRSVKKQDKSFALGLQFLLLRLLAWLPAPMVYGSAIDTACLLWQYKCKKRASCRYYDHTAFRRRFVGIQLLFEISCFLSFCIVYILLIRKEGEEEREEGKRGASPESA
ncbi:hypothetical protein E2320_005656, partial [Naja naja]